VKEIPSEHPPHVTKYPVPVLAEIRRLIAEVRLVTLNPQVGFRMAEVPAGFPQLTDKVISVQIPVSLLA